jgi:Ribophorin I
VQVKAAEVKDVPTNVSCFSADLSAAVAPGKAFKIEIQSVYTDLQKPWPAAILQSEPQRMLYFDSVYLLSPYLVESQSTKVWTGIHIARAQWVPAFVFRFLSLCEISAQQTGSLSKGTTLLFQ